MKESKLLELKNRVEGLTNVVRNLVKEVQLNANLAQGTLSAFQLHLGEEEWNKLIEELKDKEKRLQEEEKEKNSDFVGPKLEK